MLNKFLFEGHEIFRVKNLNELIKLFIYIFIKTILSTFHLVVIPDSSSSKDLTGRIEELEEEINEVKSSNEELEETNKVGKGESFIKIISSL